MPPARLIARKTVWSIGLYRGQAPLALEPACGNPVLTAANVIDRKARYVADPFLIFHEDRWHMFFEVLLDGAKPRGVIGLATSPDAAQWSYEGIAVEEPFHLSYPYVFSWEDGIYMVPETRDAGEVRLYEAEHFPHAWRHRATLIGEPLADASLFRHNGLWWLLAADLEPCCSLLAYYAPSLEGPWRPHPMNPVIKSDPVLGRPGGRVIEDGGKLLRFAQDRVPHYGARVHALEITTLSETSYEEQYRARSLLEGTEQGWNAEGMHHIDLHRLDGGGWLAAVDGRRTEFFLGRTQLPAWTQPLLRHLPRRRKRR